MVTAPLVREGVRKEAVQLAGPHRTERGSHLVNGDIGGRHQAAVLERSGADSPVVETVIAVLVKNSTKS
jgi:hypothetical protein